MMTIGFLKHIIADTFSTLNILTKLKFYVSKYRFEKPTFIIYFFIQGRLKGNFH